MRSLHIFALYLLLNSCANQTSPTGGPKDEDPPVLISSSPKNQAIFFKNNVIELEFDEYLKLKNAKEQIIISPRLDQEYTITTRKNRAFIQFEENLPDSTTFTINFREAIQDITEGNYPIDLKLSFSTGSYLDSLSITGHVAQLLTDQPVSEYSILLYDATDTFNVHEHPPLYFTKTDKLGHFLLENLRHGIFQLFAISDNNKDLYLDISKEAHGFLYDTIRLDSSLVDINLYTQYNNAQPLEIKTARQNGTIYQINYNKYISSYTIESPSVSRIYSSYADATQNDLYIYNSFPLIDSALFIITTTDSLHVNYTDSLYIKFEETVRPPAPFEQKVNINSIFPDDGVFQSNIRFNKPIQSFDSDSLYLFLDSLNIIYFDTSNYLSINDHRTQFDINYTIDLKLFEKPEPSETPTLADSTIAPTPPVKPYLYLGKGAFISIENDTLKAVKKTLTFDNQENYGTMIIEVITDEPHFIIQLLDSKFRIVQSYNNQSNFNFDRISPGDYYIRIITDSNGNAIWDPGNIFNNQRPEPVQFYKDDNDNKILTIRANWELGPISVLF